MTLNYERYLAMKSTRRFLMALMNPKDTPKVPLKIRKEARRLLKHYPEEYHMDTVAKDCPTIFGKDWRDDYK